jgi:hypothetical protein
MEILDRIRVLVDNEVPLILVSNNLEYVWVTPEIFHAFPMVIRTLQNRNVAIL